MINSEQELRTLNKSGVGSKGDKIVILIPQREYSKADALNIAAWLADPLNDEFDNLLAELKNN